MQEPPRDAYTPYSATMLIATTILLLVLSVVLALAVVNLRTSLSHLQRANSLLTAERDEARQALSTLTEEAKQIEASRAALQAALDAEVLHARREATERQTVLQQTLSAVEGRLQQAAQQLLTQRTADLNKANEEQIAHILAPFRASLGDMRQAVDGMREQSARDTAQVEKSVEQMLRQAAEIGLRADNLANAIRSNHKLQGNMGEVVLAELLESQGLQAGTHFSLQPTLRDARGRALQNTESGSRMIPDVVLHFPDRKDVVIDSKVSLNAFLDYAAAPTDEARSDALRRHVESVSEHVRELAQKAYHKYRFLDHEMLPYVIMFVPQENALQLALAKAPSLWREAFDKNVFIAGGQTLIAALRLIELAWRGQRQRESERKIVEQAEELLHRVTLFVARYEEVGARLTRLQEAYADAEKTLHTGRQSLLVPARRLVELGVKTQQPLPPPTEETL